MKSKLTFDRKAAVDTIVKSKTSVDRRNCSSDSNSITPSSLKDNESDTNSQSPSAKRTRTTIKINNNEPDISTEISSRTSKESESSLEESNPLKMLPKDQHHCKICGKAFSTPRLVTKHMLSHTKPEKCSHCGMAFRNKEEVTRHIKVMLLFYEISAIVLFLMSFFDM